ncbi:MAG: hypothetical protein DRP81_06245 [Candidatus Omnitrophota bacterium]|nr:MAG: hypothetical protein DRP81_06245 [Candidatus Omnitrophota bacterium]
MFLLRRLSGYKFILYAILIFTWLTTFSSGSSATLVFENISVDPAQIAVGTPTQVTISVKVTDPTLIPFSIELQRLDDSCNVVDVLGKLQDDGLSGDASSDDGIFTTQVIFTEQTPGQVKLRISGSFVGIPKAIHSEIFVLEVTP